MDNLNLNFFKIFYEVANCNSFLKASNKLYITQPAVSRSIAKLEEELGITLFYRANKGITLTSNGEILLKYVKDIEKLLLACERMLSSNNNSNFGTIVIGVQSHIVRNYLLEKISRFKNKYPNINFKLNDLSTLGLIEALEKHELDFVIDSSPINSPYNNLKIMPIDKLNTCFIKSKENNAKITKLSDLEDKCLIMPIERSSLRKNLIKVLDENNVKLTPQLEYATEELIIEYTKKNLGIGFVIEGESIKNEQDCIDKIELKESLPTMEINLVYIESYITELAKKFISEELLEGES